MECSPRGVARCRVSTESERNYLETTRSSEEAFFKFAAGFVVAVRHTCTSVSIASHRQASQRCVTECCATHGAPAYGQGSECKEPDRQTSEGNSAPGNGPYRDPANRDSANGEDASGAPSDGDDSARSASGGKQRHAADAHRRLIVAVTSSLGQQGKAQEESRKHGESIEEPKTHYSSEMLPRVPRRRIQLPHPFRTGSGAWTCEHGSLQGRIMPQQAPGLGARLRSGRRGRQP